MEITHLLVASAATWALGATLAHAAPPTAFDGDHEVFGVEGDEKDPFLNIREAPRRSAPIAAKLPSGTRVAVMGMRGHFKHVRVLDGPHAGKTGHAHFCCLRPVGSLDLYRTRLSAADHHNRHGVRLASAGQIVRQDRANYHKYRVRDKDDTRDRIFADPGERGRLQDNLREAGISDQDRRVIRTHTPYVEVAVWPDRVAVRVLDRGDALP